MKSKLLTAVFSAFLFTVVASAQTGTDMGTLDTIRIEVASATMVGNDLKVELELYFYNDVQDLASVGVGFSWQNVNLQLDSAKQTPLAEAEFDFLNFVYLSDNLDSSNASMQFQFVGSRISDSGLVRDPNAAKHVATYWMTYTGLSALDSIVIDTAQVGATGYTFVDAVGSLNHFPQFAGKVVHMTPIDVNVSGGSGNLPVEYALNQNYPNPFNPTTTIEFALPLAGKYSLTIYNVLGQVVEEFNAEATAPGTFTFEWEADAPSGVYFYRLVAGQFAETKKMMLLK